MEKSSIEDTLKHKKVITELMSQVITELLYRAVVHDNAKMEDPELSLFDTYTPKLAKSTYNSEEYKTFLENMKPALDHHYARYRHHPEHFKNGCRDMNIIDVIEMLVDWKAATLRHNDGNILKSLEVNRTRFSLDEVSLYDVLINSLSFFEKQNNI